MPPFRNCSVSQKKPRCPGGMKWGLWVTVPADPAFKPAARGQHVSRGLCVISASDLKLDLALLPGETPAPWSKGGIPTVAVPVPDPQSPRRNRVTLYLVWVGYAATDRQHGCQAWLQTFTPAVPSSRNSSWKLTWLSSSLPSGLCPNAHHRPHLTPQPCTPHYSSLPRFL